MKSNKKAIAGWVLSVLISAFLIFASAGGKFVDWEGKKEMMDKMGWAIDTVFKLGFVEAGIAILFLIPRAAFIATVSLTGYLGGAVATQVRINEPFFLPIVCGILAWVALGLRDPRVFATAFQRPPKQVPN